MYLKTDVFKTQLNHKTNINNSSYFKHFFLLMDLFFTLKPLSALIIDFMASCF